MEETGGTSTENAVLDASLNCEICREISKAFADHDSPYKVDLGSFEAVADSKCPKHTPLLEAFKDYSHSKTRKSDNIELQVYKGCSVSLRRSRVGSVWNLLLVKQESLPNHIGTGRILNPDWVDIGILNHWKNRCMSLHGVKCENPMKIWPTRPAWLIDVENKCIVSGLDCGNFVALSYRLGEDKGFRVNVDMAVQLQQPYILDSPEFSEHLPPIIRHAMYLTSAIGERYLWVDVLCIIHGDAADTAAQLNLMGAIYASAVVTIISADGDSQDGLPGLQHVSSTRTLEQRVLPFGEDRIVVRNTNIFSMGSWTPYHKRGWTYQGYKMSTRKIMLVKKELHWECQCSVWHEEMTLGTELDQYIDPRLQVILAGFPDIESLGHALSDYNQRGLQYEEDALPAISGLLTVLSRSFLGGFLYGLPEMLFDRALGWGPYWSHTDLKRRTVSNRSSDSRLSHSALPSWSWIGWQGLANIGRNEAIRINRLKNQIQETIPITEWYTSSSRSGSPSRRIRSTWFENRDTFKNFARPLPAGWTRHDNPPDEDELTYLYPDGCGDYHFKHRNMTDKHCDSWYYPFPVPDIEDSTPWFVPEQTPYLFCKTKRTMLWARQEDDYNVVGLLNKSGDRVGTLHLHNQEQLEAFPKEGTDDAPGRAVELVAIHRSRICKKVWDEKHGRHTGPPHVLETYTVLWVEWKEGVAYRLAAGSVAAKCWEELDLEEISLTLG
ncbi:heterokaryon incompatibility protein-domain-containing protein [Aspergillus cavernicola]|uniref:Heterokaryon incompatibility protein-domain-containing protein n=1 Tax=Aspergillus cavernicola TaxID=176166 RepID=A0ABR4I8H8_9EURO